ncbi:signal peptidase II [Acidipila sp. EB88]|uniref:signal peptidase II n=1 Tax=Acidipila sp. EB88 TaxID=2305226 RepID=UPI000F5FAD1F|nr:signal peptidase II [Acidipila sp. EB88]RRA47181.1 signal peptidase II [Acidipila sp. EB88]
MSAFPIRYERRTRRPPRQRDWRILFFLVALLVIALDRITKLWVQKHIYEGGGISVIPGVFRLSHVLNEGAAFSLFNDAPADPTRWALTAFSIVAATIVTVLLLRAGRRFTWTALGLALVLGGAIGNAWDRLQYKMVTDFLEVTIVRYHWPDFNIADSAIVVGGILLFLGALFTKQAAPDSPAQSDPS